MVAGVVVVSVGREVTVAGRDGPPGSVVVEDGNVVAAVAIVVETFVEVVASPLGVAVVVDDPSSTTESGVSIIWDSRTGRRRTAPVTCTNLMASSWLSTPGRLTTIASP